MFTSPLPRDLIIFDTFDAFLINDVWGPLATPPGTGD